MAPKAQVTKKRKRKKKYIGQKLNTFVFQREKTAQRK